MFGKRANAAVSPWPCFTSSCGPNAISCLVFIVKQNWFPLITGVVDMAVSTIIVVENATFEHFGMVSLLTRLIHWNTIPVV